MTINQAIKHLLAAAGIVVAGLAARRKIEVESLKAGCVRQTLPGVWALHTYIAKSLRDEDAVPAPSLVAMAVAVLERLSANTRYSTGEDWIFEVRGFGGKPVPVEWSVALNDFAEMMELPLPKNWTEWMLSFHQLRRGFSIAYYWGYRLSSLDALSHMLWHLDPSITRDHVFEAVAGAILPLRQDLRTRTRAGLASLNDEERDQLEADRRRLESMEFIGDAWEEGRCEYLAHRLLQTWKRDDVPRGRGGHRLIATADDLARDVAETVRLGRRSNDPDAEVGAFVDKAKNWARTNYLEPVPGVPIHCNCREDHANDLEDAECLKAKRECVGPIRNDSGKADRRPDMAFASTSGCLRCIHSVAFREDRRRIRATLAQLAAAKRLGASAAVRADAAAAYETTVSLLAAADIEIDDVSEEDGE